MAAPPPLTVVHVDAESGFSGGEVQVFLLMEGLKARGHRNVLVCPPGSRAEAEAARRGLETRPLRIRNHLSLGTVRTLGRLFRQEGADVVQTNTGRDAWLAGFGAWRAGVPSVTTRRMDRPVRRGLRTRLTYETFADRVVAISPGVEACLREGGIDPARIALIPEAVDAKRIAPARPRTVVRAALGVGEDEVLVLGMGALLPRKGFDVLIDALAAMPAEVSTSIQARIGGEGASRGALEQRIRSGGLEGRVALLGRRDDVGDLLLAADVFAMPSRAEGLGVAALEAMGAGLPVVASAVGGLAFSVRDGETGLLVPPADASALTAALERLVGDPALRAGMGEAARARVAATFLPDAMVDAYVALYRDVLSAREGGA